MSQAPRRPDTLHLRPIGFVRSPHGSRNEAPRQPAAAQSSDGYLELLPQAELEHGLADLQTFSHIWLLFWFHLNEGFRAKVAPPRSARKRGVFATRSPYRPNPLGMSLLRLLAVDGRRLHVRGLDVLDGTPILDIKPYLPYADHAADANSGWLDAGRDPLPHYDVRYSELCQQQLAFLATRGCNFIRAQADATLSLGPTPHPYRRIRRAGDYLVLAVKDFRLHFSVRATVVSVQRVDSGYKPAVLRNPRATPKAETPLEVHRDFVARFGRP